MSTNGSRFTVHGSRLKPLLTVAAAALVAGTAFGQANVYVLDLAWKELAFTNRPALGETAEIELRGIGSSDPTHLTIYLSNRAGDMLAVTEGMTATGDYARAELELNSTNLLAEFAGVSTAGSRPFDFTIWDASRSRLLASAKIEIRHNPLWESLAFTNLPALEDLGLSEYLVWGSLGTNATPSATYTIDLATKNLTADGRVAVGERAAILLKNIGDAQPAGILLYLSTKSGTGLALQAGLSATTNAGEALGLLNLATTNLVGEFADSGPTAEKALNLTVWDSARDRLLASQPIPVRNNPLAAQFTEGWTNLPDAAESEILSSLAGMEDAKLDKSLAASTYQPAGNYVSQSNLTAHVEDDENPHDVTAEQIGALTAESDPAFAAWEPTAHVPVVSAGGWLYPDYFNVSTTPYSTNESSYGPTSDYNSVRFTWQTVSAQKGEMLSAEIIHQQDWSSAVSYTNAEVLEIREAAGTFYADWPDGTESGTVGRVTAVLGDFRRTLELTYRGASAAVSNAWWVGDVSGSFRAAVNASVSNLAWAANKESGLYSPWPYTATNFLRNTNCWVAGIDLTCASPWNSDWKNYKAGTAITPQHFLYAAHFAAPTGTVFRWIDATNGIHDRTLVAQRFLGLDIALGLLDSPLPDSIAPAKCLARSDIGVLRGKYGLKNALGLRVIGLDCVERAMHYATPIMENTIYDWPSVFLMGGWTNVPFSRYGGEGGDSGNPIFLIEGTNVVLLSTFWSANSGPFLPCFRSTIEAAMVEMGNSSYTNWTSVDLSTWTNYDAGADLPDM